jgi:hypothetical protein
MEGISHGRSAGIDCTAILLSNNLQTRPRAIRGMGGPVLGNVHRVYFAVILGWAM